MKVRIPLLAAAGAMLAAVLLTPDIAEAQRRAVQRRPVIVTRPVVVRPIRTTVFVGGFYYPSFYRTSLYYDVYPRYYRDYYRPSYYQWPPYYPYGYGYGRDLSGSLRLQVTPRQAEVFIDGYYAGTVDDFDGIFQRLHVEAGEHDLTLYLAGHRPFTQRVYLQPGRTFRVRHAMEPLAPGELEPPRPTGAPLPPPLPRDRTAAGPGQPYPPAGTPGPSTAQGFGQLALRVQPADAEVLIDGEPWDGAADDERLVVELGAGLHRLEIRKDGYRRYFTDVTIRSGETRTVNVALTRQQP